MPLTNLYDFKKHYFTNTEPSSVFCALFDVVCHESPHGKATCFYEMIKAHLKEKIPSKSSFQKAIKWFRGWRKEVVAWANKQKEEMKHSIWEKLHNLIMNELPQLAPQLVVC